MRVRGLRPILAIFAAIGACTSWMQAQEATSSAAATPGAPTQPAPSFFVRLEINHETASYREGDNLSVKVLSEIDCHAYVVYHQADGKSFLIFPNSLQTDNRLKAKQPTTIPAQNELFRWQVGAPFGKEKVTLVCTKEPLSALEAQDLRTQRFNRVSPEKLKDAEQAIAKQDPASWGVAEVELTTYARSAEARDPTRKRVGVFFGVSEYQFHEESKSNAKDRGLNLAGCENDARQLAATLKEVGELSDVRVFVNDQATRKNIEHAVTRWLPQVTRPGDTVVFFFSGHGSKLPDDNRDEADGQDELLIPHDYVSVGILEEAVKRERAGSLNPKNKQRVAEALEIFRKAGSVEKGQLALVRTTALSDDLFGHWLQRLDGRQVLVILDICHAGGFGTQEKDLLAEGQATGFDFVDGEFTRLKDLGQKEMALYTSSSTKDTSSVRREGDLGVMTYFLLEAIKKAQERLTLEQAHEHCKVGMREYFQRWNRESQAAGGPAVAGHEPQIWNYSSRPLLLKP